MPNQVAQKDEVVAVAVFDEGVVIIKRTGIDRLPFSVTDTTGGIDSHRMCRSIDEASQFFHFMRRRAGLREDVV